MSEQTKLPDIVEALEWLNYRIAIDDPAWQHLRALRAEIERLRTRWEEAIEAAAKVADEIAALEDKHDRYEAWRAAHDIAQTIRSLLPSIAATPSPTGTELALDEAKRHIAILTKFWMDSAGWHKASEDARAFIGGVPTPAPAERKGEVSERAPMPPWWVIPCETDEGRVYEIWGGNPKRPIWMFSFFERRFSNAKELADLIVQRTKQ